MRVDHVGGFIAAMLCLIGCTDGGNDRNAQPPPTSRAGALPTLPASSAPTTPAEADTAAPPPGAEYASRDEGTDVFGLHQFLPRLGGRPSERWAQTMPRVTMPNVRASADLIVMHRVTPDDQHSVVAFDRETGTLEWEADALRPVRRVDLVGERVVASFTDDSPAMILDIDSLASRPLPSAFDTGVPRFYADALSVERIGDCVLQIYEWAGDLIGEACVISASTRGFVGRVTEGFVELSFPDLQPIGRVVPYVFDGTVRRATVVGGNIVAYESGTLLAIRPSGDVEAIRDSPGDITFRSAGPISPIVIVDEAGTTSGVDIESLESRWERTGFVQVFGTVGGVAYGTTRSEGQTELFSLDTGETRCVIDDEVVHGENGFYAHDGVAYDFECNEVWRLDVSADVQINVVDEGVVLVERISDEETRVSFLS